MRALLEEAGEERRLGSLDRKPRAPEEDCWGLRLAYWPAASGVRCHADFHGDWLQWEL